MKQRFTLVVSGFLKEQEPQDLALVKGEAPEDRRARLEAEREQRAALVAEQVADIQEAGRAVIALCVEDGLTVDNAGLSVEQPARPADHAPARVQLTDLLKVETSTSPQPSPQGEGSPSPQPSPPGEGEDKSAPVG